MYSIQPVQYSHSLTEDLIAELALHEEAIRVYEAELLITQLATNMPRPIKSVAASQTATNSTLFIYLGILILLFSIVFRRRLSA